MEIIWLGHSSFKLKGKDVSVITDPYDASIGFKFPKIESEIVTLSHKHGDHGKSELVGGNPFVINAPGEYEVKGVSVFGIATFHDDKNGGERGKNTVFVIEIDGVKVCHLGDLGHKLSEKQVEEIGEIDILLVPVGGFYTIGPGEAVDVINQLEPSMVVPMHYNMEGLSKEIFGKLTGISEFLKEMGMENILPVPKLVASQDKMPDEMQVVVLEKK